MTLYQYKNGFRYTSDSMFLYNFAISLGAKNHILDIGAGCGILGLLLAKKTNAKVTLIEKNKKLAKLCEKNSIENDIKSLTLNEDFLTYHIDNKFDFIVSNPPYYSDGACKSENNDLKMARYSHNFELSKWLPKAYAALSPKGSLMFCYDSGKIAEIASICQGLRPKAAIAHLQFLHPKIDKPSKLIFVHIKKNSKSPTKILAPITVFEGQNYSKRTNDIFLDTNCLSVDFTEDDK